MQRKQIIKNRLSFPEQTISAGAQAQTRKSLAAGTIRLDTANQKQIDVSREGAGFRRKAHRRIRIGASVLLNQSTT